MWRSGIVAVAVSLVVVGCGDSGDGADPARFCEQHDRHTENDPFRAFGDTATASEIEEAFAALVERVDALADVAPDEVEGAARDLAESVTVMDEEMAEAGYAPDGLDARAYRDAQVAYAEASDRLLRHLDAEC